MRASYLFLCSSTGRILRSGRRPALRLPELAHVQIPRQVERLPAAVAPAVATSGVGASGSLHITPDNGALLRRDFTSGHRSVISCRQGLAGHRRSALPSQRLPRRCAVLTDDGPPPPLHKCRRGGQCLLLKRCRRDRAFEPDTIFQIRTPCLYYTDT